MRSLLRRIIEILDGTPAIYANQRRTSGQSVVELTLVTPLLIILLMGLAEIGWFANNFLILLEVTRVGARYGTTLTGELSPLEWNNDFSITPDAGFPTDPDIAGIARQSRSCTDVRNPNNRNLQGFYNLIGCVMLQSMDPLIFHTEQDVPPETDGIVEEDDIIVSAFSLQAITPSDLPGAPFYSASGSSPSALITPSLFPNVPANDPQLIVVGRYPTNANECNVGPLGELGYAWENRDPFDIFRNNRRDYRLRDTTAVGSGGAGDVEENRKYVELEGYDSENEFQRGWVYRGQHQIDGTNGQCIGSEWTMREVEDLMNVTNFELNDPNWERDKLPSQGIVLTEIFWRHELLLKNPVFNPVFTILGDRTTIYVWAVFPLPSTEPRLDFTQD